MESKESEPEMKREEEIARYCDGEMARAEAARFERRMQSDRELRADVEQWRDALAAATDWGAGDPPGIERAESLTIPEPATREAVKRVHVSRRRASFGRRQYFAAAAIFAGGFLLGQVSRGTDPEPANTGVGGGESAEAPAIAPIPEPADAGEEIDLLPETPAPLPADEPEFLTASAPRTTIDRDGRLIVETRLRRTGGHARWTVDPSFQPFASSTATEGGAE